MKNLHYLKKFVVMVLAAMMTLSTFALPTFAAGAPMTINGVTNEAGVFDKDADVVGYQVVSQNEKTGEWELTDTFGYSEGTGKDKKWYIKGTDPKIEFKFNDKTWKPDADALAALAKLAKGDGDITFTANETAKTFVNTDETKGSWLVLVTPSQVGTIYNPMIVSRDYKTGYSVSADANAKKSNIPFEKVVERVIDDNTPATNTPNDSVTGDGLTGPDGKSPKDANFDKTDDGNLGDTAGSTGGTVTLNADGTATFSDKDQTFDNVAFRIGTKFPKYAENYFKSVKDDEGKDTYPAKVGDFYNPTFEINDKLSTGLTLNKGEGKIVVKVDGKEVKEGADTFTLNTEDSEKDFIITFNAALIKANPEKLVEVCYSAKLNKNHGVNFSGEKNTAELKYSNQPGKNTTKDEQRETNHYTFTINGNVQGNAKKQNREVIKIGLEDGEWVMKETVTAVEESGWTPLKGVKFELKRENDKDAETVKYVVTDKDGILRGMDQLDAGVYYLFETSLGTEEANQKYSVKEFAVKIEIKAELDTKGRLSKYQVWAGAADGTQYLVGNYEKLYEKSGDYKPGVYFLNQKNEKIAYCGEDGEVTDIGECARHISEEFNIEDTDTEAANIVNTPVGTLPSTGGMGTVLFTVAGAAIMALALFLLFGGKKKQHQK